MANRLTKKVGLYFIGNVSSRFLGAALIPIYAFTVSPAALGRYDYVLTVGTLVAPLAFVAIWEAALRFLIVESSSGPTSAAVSTIAFFSVGISAVSVLSALAIGWVLSVDTTNLIGLVAVAALYGLVQVWQFLARAEQETRLYVTSGILSAVVTFGLVIVLVVLFHLEFLGLLISYIVGQFTTIGLIEYRLGVFRRADWRKFEWPLLVRMLRYSGPLVLNLISHGFLGGFGRILIFQTLGDSANGIYSFAMKFATIVVSLGTVVSMSLIEEGLIRASSSKVGAFYTRVINAFISLLFLFVISLVPALYAFFMIIRGTEYFSARDLVPAMLIYASFSVIGTQFGSVFMTAGRTTALGTSTVIGAMVTVGASIVAIKPMGLFGVSLALAGGAMVTMVLRFTLSQRHIGYSIAKLRASGLLVGLIGISLLCYAAAEYSSPWFTYLIALITPCCCAWPILQSLRVIRDIPDEIEY